MNGKGTVRNTWNTKSPISIYIIKNTTHLIFIENVYSNRFSRVLCVPILENKGKWWNT